MIFVEFTVDKEFASLTSICIIIFNFTSFNKTDSVRKLSRWCTDHSLYTTKVLRWRKSLLGDCNIIHHRYTQEGDQQPVLLVAEQFTLGLH